MQTYLLLFVAELYCFLSMNWNKEENGVWGTLEVIMHCHLKRMREIWGWRRTCVEILLLVNRMSGSILNIMNFMTGGSITSSMDKMVFNSEEKKVTWLLGNVQKEDVVTMKGQLYLTSDVMVLSFWEKWTWQVKASRITMLHFIQLKSNLSGLSVSKVRVESVKGNYKCFRSCIRN